MCGFFSFAPKMSGSEINRALGLSNRTVPLEELISFKFYPYSPVPTVSKQSPNQLIMRQWGMIPRWWKEDPKKMRFATFNAKGEELVEKATYRVPWQSGQRCLLPATWFYEFETIKDEKGRVVKKLPYRVQVKDEEIIGLAGLYEIWKDIKGKTVESCTMITTKSVEPLRKIHHRQPVIIRKMDWERWLSKATSQEEASAMLRPESRLEMLRIEPAFNKTSADKITREMVE